MSRRCHHGSPRHARQLALERRRQPGAADRPAGNPDPAGDAHLQAPIAFESPHVAPPAPDMRPAPSISASDGPALPIAAQPPIGRDTPDVVAEEPAAIDRRPPPASDVPRPAAVAAQREPHPTAAAAWFPAVARPPADPPAPRPAHEPRPAEAEATGTDGLERGATAPQLRRFIKSRAYVPMHELRRRFAINGGEDDVTAIDVERQRIYVGLPPREGSLLGDLLRAGDIGYELSLDPIAPIVVGVYPMRPVPRS